MHEDTVESLVNEVIRRLRKQVLIVLTAANGYQDIILSRLLLCKNISCSIFIADNAREFHAEHQWQKLGSVISIAELTRIGSMDIYDDIYIPFMDFATLAEIANGLFTTEAASVIHHALMNNKRIMSLSYNCDPNSELNQLKGLSRGSTVNAFSDIQAKLVQAGLSFGTLDQMLNTQLITDTNLTPISENSSHQAYMTLSDVMKNGGHYSMDNRLTDLAQEYLRDKAKNFNK